MNTLPSTGSQSATTQSKVFFFGEYFVSVAKSAAKSEVDYWVSPMEQIRTQVNGWLGSLGSSTRIETEDATLLVAPRAQIPQEYFDSYESVFRTVMLYQTRLGHWNGEADVPSEVQKNAALLGLANLILALMPVPSPMLLEDGTIGAYWRRGQHYASIDFEVDGEHSWAGTDGTKYLSGIWKVPGEQLPPALINELQLIGG
ncbi:MAG: hypothetical protein KJ850_08885 [Gammaproteobacteria bacterium]|nr:hypothetical protein [Gammaproteobacteria bacterium]MBU1625152.1 hypothetical protein [Gammaproteobacteria bacterium]MBU1981412.1 hypothetical protein [Gammaproteobacteria bacterium]